MGKKINLQKLSNPLKKNLNKKFRKNNSGQIIIKKIIIYVFI